MTEQEDTTMTLIAVPWINSSEEVLAVSRALLAETRHRIAVNRRWLNPWWALTGSSGGADGELVLSVRDRLERGILLPAPSQVWAGKGTGTTCVICTKGIEAHQVENEVVIGADGVTVKLWAHLPCLNIWQSESKAVETNSRT